MKLDAKMILSLSQAKKDFSQAMCIADSFGRAVILKNNKPKYLLVGLEQEALIYDLTDEEKLKIAYNRILKQYRPAFDTLTEN